MFCSRCGTQLDEGSAFCSRCGAQGAPVVDQLAADVSPKSRLATSLLAIFLGWVGTHRFYVGKIGTAAVMLVLGVASAVCYFSAISVAVAESDEIDMPPLFFVFMLLSGVFWMAVGIWTLIDFIIAVTGNFKDNQGRLIRKW